MSNEITIANGSTVYDENDNELGVVTGTTDDGFTVSVEETVEYVEEAPDSDGTGSESEIDPREHDPGQEFGEGYIMWRCDDCGEMGELGDGLPETCPHCGSAAVYKYEED